MSEANKKIQIEFAPGAFDSFDGTQEELDSLIAELQRMADSGELEEMSIPLDEEDVLDSVSKEDREQIQQTLINMTERVRRKLQ